MGKDFCRDDELHSVCLLCQEKLDHERNVSGESGVSLLKILFGYLKVDLGKISLESELPTGKCWTEEEVIASGICEDCYYHVDAFGSKYKMFETALRFMKKSITELEKRLKLKSNDFNPGSTPAPGNGLTKYHNLKAEILKMCELKLKSGPSDEELPCVWKQQSDDVFDEDNFDNVEGGYQLNQFQDGHYEEGQIEGAQDSNSDLLDDDRNPAGIRPMTNGNQRTAAEGGIPSFEGAGNNAEDLTEIGDLVIMNNLEQIMLVKAENDSAEDELQMGLLLDLPEPLPSTSTQLLETAPPPSPPDPEVVEVLIGNTEEMRQRLDAKSYFHQNRARFKCNPLKPDNFFTYAFLIKEAIRESQDQALKFGQIYNWILSNFAYFRKFRGKATTLKNTTSKTLSTKKCFKRVKLQGKGWVWKVIDREFYKSGKWAKWSKSVSNQQSNLYTLNVKTEDTGQSGLEFEQERPGSSQNVQLWPTLPGATGRNGTDGAKRNSRSKVLSRGVTSRNCLYCKISLRGPYANWDRHVMCLHTTKHVPALAGLRISQAAVNKVVSEIGKEITTSGSVKRKAYWCTLCGIEKTGETKYHILKEHLSDVLYRLGVMRGGTSPAPGSRNFDESLASSDLIKQESQEPPMEGESGQATKPSITVQLREL